MMTSPSPDEWNLLLRLLLAQRLELNAVERIRRQACETAQAWGSRPDDDVLKLLKVHLSPDATMSVPPTAA
jgi:hypothetical protein